MPLCLRWTCWKRASGLSRVNRRFRDITIRIPRLWSEVQLRSNLELTSLCVERAKAYGFDINLVDISLCRDSKKANVDSALSLRELHLVDCLDLQLDWFRGMWRYLEETRAVESLQKIGVEGTSLHKDELLGVLPADKSHYSKWNTANPRYNYADFKTQFLFFAHFQCFCRGLFEFPYEHTFLIDRNEIKAPQWIDSFLFHRENLSHPND